MKEFDITEYVRAFKFGIRLVVLLSCLAAPIIIGVAVSSGVNSVMEKISFLYTPELKILSIQNFEYRYKPAYWSSVDLTSGEKIYFSLSRQYKGNEWKKVTDEVISLINNTYSVKKIDVIDPDTKTKEGVRYTFPDYYGTATYGQNTQLGTLIIAPVNIALFIICLALYFPIFKGIFNLFRRKKIFNK
ncbi:MAG: hypothetical protein PHV48_04210 [Candidatus Omnitrophica bacterium]|nr:hypothetical protein [Candidatus Omnitrophota bacterium]